MSGDQPQSAAISKAEALKRGSRHLRGTVADGLVADAVNFGDGNEALLKFHGTYQGFDRDSATARKQQGLDKLWQFMVRARIPAGRLTAEQYLALDAIAGAYAGGNMRVTTRQGIQFHAVAKGDLKATIAEINQALLTTLAACGDVVRNVIASPAPVASPVYRKLAEDAKLLANHLLPQSRAYHEIWLGGEKIVSTEAEIEPLYGEAYLPRKFKIAIADPSDNGIDVLANDLALISRFDGDRLEGYILALGGGLGMTHNKPKTYARLATPVAFIRPDQLVRAAEAAVRLHRDYGDREDRRHARLKYIIAERGEAWAKARLEEDLGEELADPPALPRFHVPDHMGWHPQGDGRWYLGLPTDSGRIQDLGAVRIRSALAEIARRFKPSFVLQGTQDVILGDIAPEDRDAIDAVLTDHGVAQAKDLLPVERWAMACPALPTCGLALTEAERVRGPIVGSIVEVLRRHGLAEERFSVRITGCPNGCARPYAGDIGIVGRMPGYYAIYVGGDFEGTRLNAKLFEKVAEAEIGEALEPLFAAFARDKRDGEGFGDFCHRLGIERLAEIAGTALEAVA